MDNLLKIVLTADNNERNHHRTYEIMLGRDLLDDWTVQIRFGRSGQYGRVQQFASTKPEEMRDVIRERLSRRLSAPKRIGCAYRLTAFNASDEIDTASWLSGKLLAKFFTETAVHST